MAAVSWRHVYIHLNTWNQLTVHVLNTLKMSIVAEGYLLTALLIKMMKFKFMPLWPEKCSMLRGKKQPSSWTSLKDLFPLPLSLLHVGCVVSRSNSTVCMGWYNCKLLLQFAHLSDQLFKLVLHTFEVSFQSRLHIHLLKSNSAWKKSEEINNSW